MQLTSLSKLHAQHGPQHGIGLYNLKWSSFISATIHQRMEGRSEERHWKQAEENHLLFSTPSPFFLSPYLWISLELLPINLWRVCFNSCLWVILVFIHIPSHGDGSLSLWRELCFDWISMTQCIATSKHFNLHCTDLCQVEISDGEPKKDGGTGEEVTALPILWLLWLVALPWSSWEESYLENFCSGNHDVSSIPWTAKGIRSEW